MASQRSRCTNRMKRWPPITVMLPSAGKSLPKSLCAHSDFFQSFPVRSKRRQQQAPRVWFPSARPFLCSHSECFSLYLSPPQIMSRANTFLALVSQMKNKGTVSIVQWHLLRCCCHRDKMHVQQFFSQHTPQCAGSIFPHKKRKEKL